MVARSRRKKDKSNNAGRNGERELSHWEIFLQYFPSISQSKYPENFGGTDSWI